MFDDASALDFFFFVNIEILVKVVLLTLIGFFFYFLQKDVIANTPIMIR